MTSTLPASTQLSFVNHASVLLRQGDRYLLTDPWFQKPAFGSWLPTFPPYMHPAYLAALGSRLSVLVSHGHDDHCDDEFLALLHPETEMVTADYGSPSVVNRLRRIGLHNIVVASRDEKRLSNGMVVKSYIAPHRSSDDAVLTISTGDAFVVHCNDNWFEFDPETREKIRADRAHVPDTAAVLLSQTNSASGYPLNYRGLNRVQQLEILHLKIGGMIAQGLQNAVDVGISRFVSYAGFASVFVNGHPEYLEHSLTPTARYIREKFSEDTRIGPLLQEVDVLDFYPGDVLDLSGGALTKAFVSSAHYGDADLKAAAVRFYEHHGISDRCDTHVETANAPTSETRLDYFLSHLDEFVRYKTADADAPFRSILGRTFEVVVEDTGLRRRIVFGEGVCAVMDDAPLPNKRMHVSASLLNRVLDGTLLFENLYTGYEAEWERFPANVYNRDIVMFLVMYSYLYKNRLASKNT